MMMVSLEAIFVALFVLASQTPVSRQADNRSRLDLQIDLLPEHQMTAVLPLSPNIDTHLEVKTTATTDQRRDLTTETTILRLADRMAEFTDEPADNSDDLGQLAKDGTIAAQHHVDRREKRTGRLR